MKIQVSLSIKSSEANSPIDLVVNPGDTVATLKEVVSSSQDIPFPDQELSLNGKTLDNESRLCNCGVDEGCSLKFEIKATEATLAQQLSELLQARDLSADELGLLYCYKHGANINQALKLLGFQGKFEDFIGNQKSLSINNGSVGVVREETTLKPFSAADEIVKILKANPSGIMDIKDLSQKFVQKFGVSLSSLVGSKTAEYLSNNDLFVVHGHKRVSLHGVSPRKTVVFKTETDSPPTPPPGVATEGPPGLTDGPPGIRSKTVTEAPPGLGSKTVTEAPPGLAGPATGTDARDSVDAQQYVELHNAIYNRAFNSKAMQTVNDLVAAIAENSFLDIDHVVTGGSIGKGTVVSGIANAEIVLFLRGLPATCPESWLPPVLKATAAVLEDQAELLGLCDIQIAEESVMMRLKNSSDVIAKLVLSPAFDSYEETVQVLGDQVVFGEQGPNARRFYTAAFAKERTQFISRQPSSVKMTIRLMKWWRDQQQWSSELTYPSDEILELAVVYSAVQTKPADQKTAIANVMSLLSRFKQLRVVWSNYYSKDDVWGPLLRQKPLLMDPVNPFVNVADPRTFRAAELMELARTTHFFW